MIIKRIKLENIRSYENAEIELPKGSVLLSGDIGSGKSTLLLALEFALFGLQPGFMKGSSLLRHSADSGSVEIEIEVKEKNVVIKRTLERKKDSVSQGKKNFINIDGKIENLGPEELKARVLELMNYPLSLLKSRTNLLFRYTLYTPQEEMKQILLEKPEERINTLRKVFDIDKYKNIISCSEIISSKIKEKIKILEVQVLDLGFKKQEKNSYEIKLDEEEEKITSLIPEINEVSHDISENKKHLEQLSQKIRKLNELKSEAMSLKILLKTASEQKDNSLKEVESLNKSIEKQKDNFVDDFDFKSHINSFNSELKKYEEIKKETIIARAGRDSKKRTAQDIKLKIITLVKCPTCMQDVSESYKQNIIANCDAEIDELNKNIEALKNNEYEIEKKISNIREKIENLHEKEKQDESLKLKLKMIEEQKKLRDNLLEIADNLSKKAEDFFIKLEFVNHEIDDLKNAESDYLITNEKIDKLREKEKSLEIRKAQHEKQADYYRTRISEILNEIEKKEKILERTAELKKLNEWLNNHFIKIISAIEKVVMVTINKEFNVLFEKWFSIFVDNLNIRVDENFTPIIEQQGYDISYESLSGGERTAAALSYRLALNQIINNLMSKLSTRNLLILDEPTDGFSSEQLDKMRDIFKEIKTDQLILVSHESKIESFVDYVIRFAKKGNISFARTNEN